MFFFFRHINYGNRDEKSVVSVLKEKQYDFLQNGVTVLVRENPLIITVITPIMKRANECRFAQEVVFVDSSGSCDQTNTCVTFFFAANKIGAIPLAIVLHTAQSESNYTLAFSAVKDALGINSFGGQGFPGIIFTDDSIAERNALKAVFPQSHLLLCTFHVCQAFWRWLWDSHNSIEKTDRKKIMLAFRLVIFANTDEECTEYFQNLIQEYCHDNNYQNLKIYLEAHWSRRQEWCLHYRNNLITRGNNTNNYVESSIRIFKDIVLERCRSFNSCALIDFIVKVFENYHKRRLLEYANSRHTSNKLAYLKFSKNIEGIRVTETDRNVYLVTSQSDNQLLYTVYTDIAMCDCPFGQGGRFCKHLCAVQEKYGIRIHTAPLLTKDDKQDLAKLALGENIPTEFFKNMDDIHNDSQSILPEPRMIEKLDEIDNEFATQNKSTENDDFKKIHQEAVQNLSQHFSRITEIVSLNGSPNMTNTIQKINNVLAKIKTPAQVECFLAKIKTNHNYRKIGVQPTSVSRRKVRPGLHSGAKRIQAGRPTNNELGRPKKRKRNLAVNIFEAQPNAKSHGSQH